MKNLCKESLSTSASNTSSAAAMIALSKFGKPSRPKNQKHSSTVKSHLNASIIRKTLTKIRPIRNLALESLLIRACLLFSAVLISPPMENSSCFLLESGKKTQNHTLNTVPSSIVKISWRSHPLLFLQTASLHWYANSAQSCLWRKMKR